MVRVERLPMTEKKPTKYYSSKQENRIADYLGWSAVSASGARPFNPGDIKSSEWLAECKTHTEVTDTITISKSVWEKLANEARGYMRKPVLFVDNGTQKIENTWAIFPKRLYFGGDLEVIELPIRESDKKYTFKHSIFSKAFSGKERLTSVFINSESLYIVEIHTFKKLFCEGE